MDEQIRVFNEIKDKFEGVKNEVDLQLGQNRLEELLGMSQEFIEFYLDNPNFWAFRKDLLGKVFCQFQEKLKNEENQ